MRSAADWECLGHLIDAVEAAAKESREMLVKCQSKVTELAPLQALLDKYRKGERSATHLTKTEVKGHLERHYPTEWCKREETYLDKGVEPEPTETKHARKCHLKSGKAGSEAHFSIVTVTLALGRQLLAEHAKAL